MKKRYYVKIELELHAVTCPGVWLCTTGYLEITIKSLGYFFKTGPMDPKFPILCHDMFVMEGYFQSVNSLTELERVLGFENIEISLWQNACRLAYFNGKLGQIMYNSIPALSCFHNVNVQVLMSPAHSFPGIIAPKLELTARAIAQDHNPSKDPHRGRDFSRMSNNYPVNISGAFITPTTSQEMFRVHNHQREMEFRRQKPVCHSKSNSSLGSNSPLNTNQSISRSQFCRKCSPVPSNSSLSLVSGATFCIPRRLSGNSDRFSNNTRSISSLPSSINSSPSIQNYSSHQLQHREEAMAKYERKHCSNCNASLSNQDNDNDADDEISQHSKTCDVCKLYQRAFTPSD